MISLMVVPSRYTNRPWPGQCFLIRTWVLLLFALLLFFSISFLVPAGV